MRFLKDKLFLSVLFLVFALPILMVALSTPKETRSNAQASTILSFFPASTQTAPLPESVGKSFPLDVYVSPGSNLVSLMKIEIDYDSTRFNIDPLNPVIINYSLFPQVLQDPIYSTGKIQLVVSIGSDASKAISTNSKVFTLNLIPTSSTSQTKIYFGSITSVNSLAVQDGSSENVLSSTSPAYIKISKKHR